MDIGELSRLGVTMTDPDPFPVDRLRADTPGCARGAHFLHSGASLMPRPVLDAVRRHLDLEAEVGGYAAARLASGAIDDAYRSVARMIGADAADIAMVENATVAWGQVLYGMAAGMRPGDRIVTSRAEYASNFLSLLQVRRRHDVEIVVVPDDEHGQVDVTALRDRIDDRVRLIAMTHVPTGNGLVQPVAEVGQVARELSVPFLLDACQSVGQMPVDVGEVGCDFLCASARKFLRGPRGVGFLYARSAVRERFEPAMIDLRAATWTSHDAYELRDDARRFENWEGNVAGVIGLGAAADYAMDVGLAAIRARVWRLAEDLRERLRGIDGVEVTDVGRERCGIVSFRHDRRSPPEIEVALRDRGFEVGTSTVASTRLLMEGQGLSEVARAAVHYINTAAEVSALANELGSL